MSASEKPIQLLKAYGDRRGDGMVQMSFTLEIPPDGLVLVTIAATRSDRK